MAGEKAKITLEIVDSIVEDVQARTVEINEGFKTQIEEEVRSYRNQKEGALRTQIERIENQAAKEQSKLEAEMRFDVAKKLRAKRAELMKEFSNSLHDDVVAFSHSDQYKHYFESALETLKHEFDLKESTFKVREEDRSFVEGLNYEITDLPLGGFICEHGKQVYDFTLETRYQDAIKTFIAQSNVGI
ncbi:hypothetical protein G7062_06390 [Erysipelothrix sp. HDW6C]|uniref:hypothetical protein n=1 Tax=Erysipelothrix sp. HDW6C TaxID=2714930 RepID=UPI001409977B|nr:hypothetical protein [Erysipelothrix sp. HDW6C]QIK69936.1 hypothetical protein G7062_06390 [Erysipelothrix sp. HDW6C]